MEVQVDGNAHYQNQDMNSSAKQSLVGSATDAKALQASDKDAGELLGVPREIIYANATEIFENIEEEISEATSNIYGNNQNL